MFRPLHAVFRPLHAAFGLRTMPSDLCTMRSDLCTMQKWRDRVHQNSRTSHFALLPRPASLFQHQQAVGRTAGESFLGAVGPHDRDFLVGGGLA